MISLSRYLSMDPYILISAVNMQLRDHEFESLDDLCSYHDIDRQLLEGKLKKSGFTFVKEQNQFK